MFKLTVVGGPAKGTSYALNERGETSIGRIDGNDVVLPSAQVSKKHCVLVVNNSGVTVKDAGSSNGTFVNGILTKLKAIKPGDRVSVGEFVFELVRSDPPNARLGANIIPISPGIVGGLGVPHTSPDMPGSGPGAMSQGLPSSAAPPQGLAEKVRFLFDQYVINFVYNLNEKHEWNILMAGMLTLVVAFAAVVSVYPLFERVQEKLTNEAAGRALVLARQMVDRNAPFVFERQESKLDIAYIEREPGVVAAYLIDMDQRVLAPGRMLNQSVAGNNEGAFAATAVKLFREKEAAERFVRLYGNMVAVAIPLRVFSPSAAKNVTVSVGLVYYDRGTVVFDSGTEALAYIQALILAAIMGVIVYFALYRLTLRPLNDLNDQIDQVLKGNALNVEKKFKMEEINPLIDVINSALQRAQRAGSAAIAGNGPDEVLESLKFAADRMVGGGMILFSADRRIVHWSRFIEEITAIRAETAIGQEIGAVARDAAFGAFIEDLFARAPFLGAEPVGDDFEFSGTSYRLEALATGSPGSVKYYIVTAIKPAWEQT